MQLHSNSSPQTCAKHGKFEIVCVLTKHVTATCLHKLEIPKNIVSSLYVRSLFSGIGVIEVALHKLEIPKNMVLSIENFEVNE